MVASSPPHAPEGDPGATPLRVEALERVAAPSPEAFVTRYLTPRRPVVLTGLTEGWAPPAEWTFERLAARYGDARVVGAVLEAGKLFDDPATGVVFRRVPLRDFVASLGREGGPGLYVMAPTWNFPSAFERDYRVPPYCGDAWHFRGKVWLGKGGTVTPVHRDVPHNLHVHLIGRKRWLLFPPGSAGMYSRGLLSGMPNFSEVDPEQPDYARHPRFRDVRAWGGVIAPGETLFIPRGWWHHTRTLDDAVSMNFWWGGAGVQLASLASTTFKRLRRIRHDEWARD